MLVFARPDHVRRVVVALVAALSLTALSAAPAALAATHMTFTVTTTADTDDGCDASDCTLREAINAANASTGTTDTIAFAIPDTDAGCDAPTGVCTIRPSTALPAVADPVVIDGYTQPGAAVNTSPDADDAQLKIELNGDSVAGTPANGLEIRGGGSTVRGLVINGFVGQISWPRTYGGNAILLHTGDGNTVEGNYIGTDAAGGAQAGSFRGVLIEGASSGNVVGTDGDGSDDLAERNVIASNFRANVHIYGAGADNNTVAGNLIGTDRTGTVALPVADAGPGYENVGVWIERGPRANTVGTNGDGVVDAAERNVVSGARGQNNAGQDHWSSDGITLLQTADNVVAGNYVGTDVTGTVAIPNRHGIHLNGATGTRIGTNGDGTSDVAERNLVSGNTAYGLSVNGADTVVAGNYVGSDASGTEALRNGGGVWVYHGTGARVGGPSIAERNLVSGNRLFNIAATGPDHVVQNNYVGTDVTGSFALSAPNVGISATGTGTNPTTTVEDNLVSGHTMGLYSAGIGAGGSVTVRGNLVGTDASGTSAIPNSIGISVGGKGGNTIGGTAAADANVTSGNSWLGMWVSSGGNHVLGNKVGVDVSGGPLANAQYGLHVAGAGNTIGGSAEGAGNLVAHNAYSGVLLYGGGNTVEGNTIERNAHAGVLVRSSSNVIRANSVSENTLDGIFVYSGTGSAVRGNAIWANGGLGIDLGRNGVTANDAHDADTGANTLQNFPLLASAESDGASTVITGTLHSTPDTAFELDFFDNEEADPSGHGEGARSLGAGDTTTDANGDATFSITVSTAVAAGRFVSATATAADGSTSEFSATVTATTTDNCPDSDSPDQTDSDGDGAGDACDPVFNPPGTNGLPVLGDRVWFDADEDGKQDVFEPGMRNVRVELHDSAGALVGAVTTGWDGHYGFHVDAGDYTATLTVPGGWSATTDVQHARSVVTQDVRDADFGLDYDGDSPDPADDNCPDVHNPGQADSDGDGLGDACDSEVLPPSHRENGGLVLGDRVWFDADEDGEQDFGEPGIPWVRVNLLDDAGTKVASATTGVDGGYLFAVAEQTAYTVEIDASNFGPTGILQTALSTTGGETQDSAVAEESVLDADFGYIADGDPREPAEDNCDTRYNPGQDDDDGDGIGNACDPENITDPNGLVLGDRVWHDSNKDGLQDTGEHGIPWVRVDLLDATGTRVGTATTGQDGHYLFGVAPSTDYEVVVHASNFASGGALFDTVPTTDNHPQVAQRIEADSIHVVDFGYFGDGDLVVDDNCLDVFNPGQEDRDGDGKGDACDPLLIGDRVWYDTDSDGVQDPGEVGIDDVVVTLLGPNGAELGSRTTAGDGGYLFSLSEPAQGDYTVRVDPSNFADGGRLAGMVATTDSPTQTLPVTVYDELDFDFGYDLDGDGIPPESDNCDDVANPDQADNDRDGIGDACDPDDDNDSVDDEIDNCQFIANAEQADTDGDGIGDMCDSETAGNIGCSPSLAGLKVEPPGAGIDGADAYEVTVADYTPSSFTWSSNTITAVVLVKAGPVTKAIPANDVTGTATSPINPRNGQPYDISHISFCY